MISKLATKHHLFVEPGFQWRGDEISRIEGLSDAVFAFAVTLLIVSLEVPKNFEEFYRTLAGLPSFAMTFVMLMFIWFEQYKYFRRYGLQDKKTVILTIALLFVVLYYVYPMKFLFNAIFAPIIHAMFPSISGLQLEVFTSPDDVRNLMILYNVGVLAIYTIFYVLYRHARRFREVLNFNEVELFDTNWSMYDALFFMILSTVGLSMALIGGVALPALSGMMYGPVCGLYFTISSSFSAKRRETLVKQLG